ncbi:MAG: hypothetical protein SGILL_000921, partial [Bacillariaceae sp.]
MLSDKTTVRLTLLLCLGLQGLFVLKEYRNGGGRELQVETRAYYGQQSALRGTSSIGAGNFLSAYNYTTEQLHHLIQNMVDSSPPKSTGPNIHPRHQAPHSSTIWDLSIDDLANTSQSSPSDCDPPRLTYWNDTISPNAWSRKIPKVVHITGKTRCLSQPFYENLKKWQLQDHSLYFHDDAAVDRLLQEEYWPEFPQLKNLQHCMVSGAAKADLWRYLILYRYGGIYTDMDSAPGPNFFRSDNTTTIISSKDDGFFVVERIGVLSQYFMATSPRHPLMFMAVQQVFSRLMETNSIGLQYVPFVTGPGALKNAYIRFMGRTKGGTVTEGVLHSPNTNRSITVAGKRRNTNTYIQRESLPGIEKRRGYKLMGMEHFSKAGDPKMNISCYEHLFH